MCASCRSGTRQAPFLGPAASTPPGSALATSRLHTHMGKQAGLVGAAWAWLASARSRSAGSCCGTVTHTQSHTHIQSIGTRTQAHTYTHMYGKIKHCQALRRWLGSRHTDTGRKTTTNNDRTWRHGPPISCLERHPTITSTNQHGDACCN